MQQTLRRIYSGFTTVLVTVVVILAILLVGVRVAGIVPYTVLSGSMEPTYHVGSLIYVKSVDPMTLKVGDPLTYRMPDGTVVTHRIIEVLEDSASERRFRTQGDANEIPDGSPVNAKNIIGKPLFTIPYMGYVSWFVQNPPGTYVVLAGAFALLILTMLTDVLFPPKTAEEEQKEEEKTSAENAGDS
ncbi:MAG: signal peptidase I [Ruminococcaceae bacterium]|nr:signal peptidase I [Oscillospiraceae bacterium]